MQATLENQLEAKRVLYTYARTIRCGKRLELAQAMAQEESRLKRELDRLERKAKKN